MNIIKNLIKSIFGLFIVILVLVFIFYLCSSLWGIVIFLIISPIIYMIFVFGIVLLFGEENERKKL